MVDDSDAIKNRVDFSGRHANDAYEGQSILPRYDGKIHMELSNDPVTFHFTGCFPCEINESECTKMALHLCRLACMSLDVVRGKMPAKNLERRMTKPCINKLVTMAKLVDIQMRTDPELRRAIYPFPAIPKMMDGMLKSECDFEASVCVQTGQLVYWISIVLRHASSRWICDFADIG